MTGNEYQEKAKKTAIYPKEAALYYLALGLTGEAGEIANKAKKIIRDDNFVITQEKIQTIKKELGDVMWYIAMFCNELDISLDDVMEKNIEKLYSRFDRNAIGGDGDDR